MEGYPLLTYDEIRKVLFGVDAPVLSLELEANIQELAELIITRMQPYLEKLDHHRVWADRVREAMRQAVSRVGAETRAGCCLCHADRMQYHGQECPLYPLVDAVQGTSEVPNELNSCDFCLKLRKDVQMLVAGPGIAICNECISIANGLLAGQPGLTISIAVGPAPDPKL